MRTIICGFGVPPWLLSMGWIRKRVQKDWWVQCFQMSSLIHIITPRKWMDHHDTNSGERMLIAHQTGRLYCQLHNCNTLQEKKKQPGRVLLQQISTIHLPFVCAHYSIYAVTPVIRLQPPCHHTPEQSFLSCLCSGCDRRLVLFFFFLSAKLFPGSEGDEHDVLSPARHQ